MNIHWRWDDSVTGGRDVILDGQGGNRFVFSQIEDRREFGIQSLPPIGGPSWVHTLPISIDAAALVERGGRLYVALYRTAVTGCRVMALDAATGNQIWEAPLQGLGMLHHSKYFNRVQMTFVGDSLVVFGNESAGRYVEELDPQDGHLISNWVERR